MGVGFGPGPVEAPFAGPVAAGAEEAGAEDLPAAGGGETDADLPVAGAGEGATNLGLEMSLSALSAGGCPGVSALTARVVFIGLSVGYGEAWPG
ncbi:hypothetical protein FDG2_0973 [Candidatus Protofrankia californiensis]|uniref:Uncharacterized protein n=1 Tax=Candidatus Protofrankia californiensis TaxID=1839754 RepID=A0A1C3NUP6_9ACTN|nr:hypothetical protein FDG2_0973 [Candidatus Protofrankia californiensis]